MWSGETCHHLLTPPAISAFHHLLPEPLLSRAEQGAGQRAEQGAGQRAGQRAGGSPGCRTSSPKTLLLSQVLPFFSLRFLGEIFKSVQPRPCPHRVAGAAVLLRGHRARV